MPLEKLEYSKNWENPQDFPTYEAREEQVRADIQLLFNEAKNAFNKMIDDLAADLVPFAETPSIPASNVQSAIEAVQQQVEDMVMGATPDRSITGIKLAFGAVGNDELAEDAVGASNLQNDSVGSEAIAPEAIQTEHYSPGSIPKEAFKTDALDDKADLVSGRVPPLQTTKVVNKVSLASAYTLALSDLGKIIFCQNVNAGTINIPTNASAAFAVGAEIVIIQGAAGSVTVSGVSGVTLASPTGTTVLNKINSALKLTKTSTNTWNAYYLDYLPPNSVGTTELAEGAVSGAKLANYSVTSDKVADTIKTQYYTLEVGTAWDGTAAPYTQTITANGMLTTDRPKVFFMAPSSFADVEAQQEAFTMLYDVDSANGSITLYAKDKPAVAFTVLVEVSRI